MSDANFSGQGPDPGDQDEGSGFAEVLNGLTLGGGKRRKPKRPEPAPEAPFQFQQYPQPPQAQPPPQGRPDPAWPGFDQSWPPEPPLVSPVTDRRWPLRPPEEDDVEDTSFVRPYAWTGGRTKSTVELRVETLLTATDRARDGRFRLQAEHQSVAELCGRPRSVAEVASLMSVPLGVAKVLLGDMAELGLVTVHKTANGGGNASHLKLMERVLSGLRRL
ncbi:DUF742 domain-containing protein [Labedaea rhizosphaerae]|uniref:Uncharacterized protein DUF742 n=1 Tax=Labedaea rhizosphaerae TaxID=598644 RepID=A0A4V3CZ86_LABRH|nr:DUF742 domain-containing protein [Labedaea rhizosphaerae]TDP97098.1 uncharacterized protein DUF742 [Labedaea rhizosphaerae]